MNIKKFLVGAAAGALMLGSMAIPALAAPGGKDSPANDNPQNLYLYPKNTTTWAFDFSGAWGKYNFKLSGADISGVFNGHGLVPDVEYTLISYNDPWTTSPQIAIIGSDVADAGGNVHIAGSADLGSDVDSNNDGSANDGYKIWLVPNGDIVGTGGAATLNWTNMAGYLWEHNLVQ